MDRHETTDVLVTIEGHHDAAAIDVATALDDLVDLLAQHQPQATIQSTATLAPLTGWTT